MGREGLPSRYDRNMVRRIGPQLAILAGVGLACGLPSATPPTPSPAPPPPAVPGPPAPAPTPSPAPEAPPAPPPTAATGPLTLGPLDNLYVIEGCSCSAFEKTEKPNDFGQYTAPWVGLGGNGQATIHADGADRDLAPVGPPPASALLAGSHYAGGGYDLSLRWENPTPCAPPPACESTGYTVTFTVTRTGSDPVSRTLPGECGC